jgi:hypothetical protein
MNITCVHVAANCNPKTNVLAFIDPHLIAYAFADQIGIYSLSQNYMVATISGTSQIIQTKLPTTRGSIASLCTKRMVQ